MKIFIIIYLTIGALSNILGPLSKKVNEIIKDTRSSTITRLINKPYVKKREDLFLEIILRTFSILFFPILYISLVVEFFRYKYISPRLRKIINDPRLYYRSMGGMGIIRCQECDYEQNIICCLHGAKNWNQTGYQCQTCGKFEEIKNGLYGSTVRKCDCGGDLDREKPIFCPKCKKNNVSYDLKGIT